MSLFESLAVLADMDRTSSRKALAVANKRAQVRFSSFLDQSSGQEEWRARFSLVEKELQNLVVQACAEAKCGAVEEIYETVVDHLAQEPSFPDRTKAPDYEGPDINQALEAAPSAVGNPTKQAGEFVPFVKGQNSHDKKPGKEGDENDVDNDADDGGNDSDGGTTARVRFQSSIHQQILADRDGDSIEEHMAFPAQNGKDTATGLSTDSPVNIDKKTWQPSNMPKLDVDKPTGMHNTVDQDITQPTHYTGDPFNKDDGRFDSFKNPTETQDLSGATGDDSGFAGNNMDNPQSVSDVWHGTENQENPVTREPSSVLGFVSESTLQRALNQFRG